MVNRSAAHSPLVNDILVELSKRPGVRVWKVHAGKYRVLHDPDQVLTIGNKGHADISGIIKIAGRGIRLEIEVKTGSAVQTAEQRAFQAMILGLGGEYIVARCIEDATSFCDELLSG